MEKRFVLFLALSLGILVGYSLLSRMFFPPPPPVVDKEDDLAAVDVADEPVDDGNDTAPGQPAPLRDRS